MNCPVTLPSDLPTTLRERVHQVHGYDCGTSIGKNQSSSSKGSTQESKQRQGSFVLYLPTVVLRYKHNPAFALACRIANQHNLPLIVLAVVADDKHLPAVAAASPPSPTILDTSSVLECDINSRSNSSNTGMSTNPTHTLHSPSPSPGPGFAAAAAAAAAAGSGSRFAASNDAAPTPVICRTARRLAFVLQALQEATHAWEAAGAGVAIRVHAGAQTRTPHHLTLLHSSKAACVILDEPFVHPYVSLTRSVEQVAREACIPCWRVDGSTTVPPACFLSPAEVPCSIGNPNQHTSSGGSSRSSSSSHGSSNRGSSGVPAKAWMWEKRTASKRRSHVQGAVQEGHLDAPALKVRLPRGFFLDQQQRQDLDETIQSSTDSQTFNKIDSLEMRILQRVQSALPTDWKDPSTPAPSRRPWTVQELAAIPNLFTWVMQESHTYHLSQADTLVATDSNTATPSLLDIDTSVPPCTQTHGSMTAGMQRWSTFEAEHLKYYAQKRNDIRKPHAVSRMSAYLNLGVVSIFELVHRVWECQKAVKISSGKNKRGSSGHGASLEKYLDELIKWREIGYAHAFALPMDYNQVAAVPAWSQRYLASCHDNENDHAASHRRTTSTPPLYTLAQLESGTTSNATWNAMQHYLTSTGELHNNARMTWGKTIVHWQKWNYDLDALLRQLCYLNDRYALDGLSPPSYAGLLWCLGWCDSPKKKSTPAAVGNLHNRNHTIQSMTVLSDKPASRYRHEAIAFRQAAMDVIKPVAQLQSRKGSNSTTTQKNAQSIAAMLLRQEQSNVPVKRAKTNAIIDADGIHTSNGATQLASCRQNTARSTTSKSSNATSKTQNSRSGKGIRSYFAPKPVK